MNSKGDFKLIIITGLSGAGKTLALRCLEDLGYFCVDNLPPNLVSKFAELFANSEQTIKKIALVMDVRGGHFFSTFFDSLKYLEQEGYNYEILFFEASDETLIRRFKQTRRKHPLSREGSIVEGIVEERKLLYDIRGIATKIIDTTDLTPVQLREQLRELVGEKDGRSLLITVMSFGFKYGLPLDSDLVLDVRFLPNPHYSDDLRPKTGEDADVENFVMRFPETRSFINKLSDLLLFLLPYYVKEGKSHLVVSIGCTGGKHRSVALSRKMGEILSSEGYKVSVRHRDINRE
ncbi:MAG: RNase adapter RapZ [Clostridia bacterium]|nr:RNase adapter RapZ [Clostridia bacterium]